MIRKLQNLIHSRVFKNFINLLLLQFANYCMPLITFPYLIRVMGASNFGLISFSSSLMALLSIVSDYGFNLSATRQISINRQDSIKLSSIFSSVITIKIGLSCLVLVLLYLSSFYVDLINLNFKYVLINFGVVVGGALFPTWLFHGIERMGFVSSINVFSKIFTAVMIFLFVKSNEDLLIVPLLYSLGFILPGAIGIFLATKKLGIMYELPYFSEIKFQLREGWRYFLSNISIGTYTQSLPILIGIFSSELYVGYYSGAEKLIKAIQGLYTPLSQALFPFVSNLMIKSQIEGRLLIRRIIMIGAPIVFFLCLILFFLSEFLIEIYLGKGFYESVRVMKILSFTPFIIFFSNMFGVQGLVSLGQKRYFSNILLVSSLFGICLSLFLIPRYFHIGAAFVSIMIEVVVTVLMALFFYRTK